MSDPAGAPQAPWQASLEPAFTPVWQAWQQGRGAAQALNGWAAASMASAAAVASRPAPVAVPHFVPQSALPPGEAYEAFIHRSGQVPTRDLLHDLFNGLVWFSQPALKRRLNALQAQAIAAAGIGPQRGPLRDALTLMDENGALLQAPPALWQALVQRDWTRVFITQRALWQQACLTVVGHALLEQLATRPRKPLTAHVLLPAALCGVAPAVPHQALQPWPHPGPQQAGQPEAPWASDALALSADDWARKPFCPLPVLGVPGWWPGNDEPGFYADASVFRPPRGAAAGAHAAAQAGR